MEHEDGKRAVVKIRGVSLDLLLESAPEIHRDHVIHDRNGNKTLHCLVLKGLYGMLIASMSHYKKFKKDIKSIGFELTPHDPCVGNRIVNAKDDFLVWLQDTCGEEGVGKVKAVMGKKHDHLAMILDFSVAGKLRIDMMAYANGMIVDFPFELKEHDCPWTEKLFKVDKSAPKLDTKRKKISTPLQ